MNWEVPTGAELGVEIVVFLEAVEAAGYPEGDDSVILRSIGSSLVFGTAGAARWTGVLENQGSCMFDDPA